MFLTGPFIYSDIVDYKNLHEIVLKHRITWLFQHSALLSAVGKANVSLARAVNITDKSQNLAQNDLFTSFSSSSVRGFSDWDTVHWFQDCIMFWTFPQNSICGYLCPAQLELLDSLLPGTQPPTSQRPSTIYGVSKVHTELLGEVHIAGHDGSGFPFLFLLPQTPANSSLEGLCCSPNSSPQKCS